MLKRKATLRKGKGGLRASLSSLRNKGSKSIPKQGNNVDNALWRVFSLYTRLEFADRNDRVQCISCLNLVHFKEADAGHYIERGVGATRFDEDNVWPQCRTCNRSKDGNLLAYYISLEKLFGKEGTEALWNKRHGLPLTGGKKQLLLDQYTEKLKALKDAREQPGYRFISIDELLSMGEGYRGMVRRLRESGDLP